MRGSLVIATSKARRGFECEFGLLSRLLEGIRSSCGFVNLAGELDKVICIRGFATN